MPVLRFLDESRPVTAFSDSSPDGCHWNDRFWMERRAGYQVHSSPLNIYELHLGSWRRTGDGQFLTYREIAHFLVPYVKELGFTHVHLLPVSEYQSDASWGYQCTDPFTVTSRFGTSDDFKHLVDMLHTAGVGIILDWVCTCSPEEVVQNEAILISNALFWLEEFHVDGLRPVTPYGSHDDPQMTGFLRRLNKAVLSAHPDVLLIAGSIHAADPDFRLAWNTDWIRSLLHYAGLDHPLRQHYHKDLISSLSPIPSAPTILALSHDEIVHKKGSLLNKMPGSDPEKFAGVRAFYTYMLTHPGKKLTMMGCEFGQWDEWNYDRSLDWHLLAQQDEDGLRHRQLHAFFKAANAFYLTSPALWQQDFSPDGFRWICPDDASGGVIAFLRTDKTGRSLLVAINFSPVFRTDYQIGVPQAGQYAEVFNSDLAEFGGKNRLNTPTKSNAIPCHGMNHSLQINLPPLSAIILKRSRKTPTTNNNKQVMK